MKEKTAVRWGVLGVAVLILSLVAGSRPAAVPSATAQTSGQLVLSNILVQSVTADQAIITWSTVGVDSDSVLFFGTTTEYEITGTDPDQAPHNDTQTQSHSMVAAGLTEQTTYHFKVMSRRDTQIVESSDRTFRTPSAAGDTTAPTIINLNFSANNVSARAVFDTTKPARATIRYGQTPSMSEGSVTDDLSSSHELLLPQDGRPALVPNTRYYYQISAQDSLGNIYQTAELTFTTTGSANDRTFTTGACRLDPDGSGPLPDGSFEIGACYGGYYCDGGTPRQDCTRCGNQCQANQTCVVGGVCNNDPTVGSNVFQCNKDLCYNDDQSFKNPAPAGCWRSWPRCSANVVLRVQRDRVCGQWMTCSVSQQVTNTDGSKQDICTGLGACSSLGPGGTCNQVLGQGQCSGDPMRFCFTNADCQDAGGECITVTNPTQKFLPITYAAPQVDDSTTEKIKNLTGAINVGLDWQESNRVIQGQYPWFLAPQWGESLTNFNAQGNFESNAQSRKLRGRSDPGLINWAQRGAAQSDTQPQFAVVLEAGTQGAASSLAQGQNDLNHVLSFTPGTGGTRAFFGPTDGEFTGLASLSYFVKFRARTTAATNVLQPQIGFNCTTPDSNCGGYRDLKTTGGPLVQLTTNWQQFTLGPVQNISNKAWLNFFIPASGSTAEILIDDVSVSAVLEVRPSEYLFPTCRLYAQGDAESCTYITQEGVKYTGQSGYCLERDPKNPNICLSWWPVDAIRGEVNAFGNERAAGYAGPVPLYYCLQSRMYVQKPEEFETRGVDNRCLDGGSGSCEERDCEANYNRRRCENNPTPGSCDGEGDANGGLCPTGYRVIEGSWHCGGICDRNNRADDCSFRCKAKNANVTSQLAEYSGTETVLPNSTFVQRCALVAKVADIGLNAAWANRTQLSSSYRVPSLLSERFTNEPVLSAFRDPAHPTTAQYPSQSSALTYPIDYPFGQIRPDTTADPAAWAPIQIRATCEQVDPTNPTTCLTTETPQVPGVAAGVSAPYAWTTRLTQASTNASCGNRDAQCSSNVACVGVQNRCSNTNATCVTDLNCRLGTTGDTYRACTFADPSIGRCSGTNTQCNLNTRVCSHDRQLPCTSDAACSGVPGSVCLTPDSFCNQGVTCNPIGSTGRKQCSNGAFVSANGEGRCTDADGRTGTQTCSTTADCSSTVSFCKQEREIGGRVTGKCTTPGGVESTRTCTTDADCSFCVEPKFCEVAADCDVSVCEPPKVCEGTATPCTAPINAVDPACGTNVKCVAQVEGSCVGGAECSNFSQCHGTSNECLGSGGTCQGGLIPNRSCSSDQECVVEFCQERDSGNGSCKIINPGSIQAESAQLAINRLKLLFTQQYGVWYWNSRSATPRYEKCTSVNCTTPAADPLNPTNPYVLSTQNFLTTLESWRSPVQICPVDDATGRHTRPTPPVTAGDETDFCGIPPRVFNAQWLGGQTAITINRGQIATLTFNTEADPEQKPLKQIYIDWKGNGSAIQSTSFPYDSKSNASDPHVFRYPYNSTSLEPELYHPKVLVMDNWGWCNNGQTGAICSTPVASWQDLGLTVTVK